MVELPWDEPIRREMEMTDRYAIVSHDWQRFDRRYAVVDTFRNNRPIIQTNEFARAIQVRDEMNVEASNS